MNKNSFYITVLGLGLGFLIGFWVANNFFYDRDRNTTRTAAPASQPNGSAEAPAGDRLTPEELKNFIARADNDPSDIELQKETGVALYRYASGAQDPSLLPDVRRLLERAIVPTPNDLDLLIALGNVNFDIGQSSDPTNFKRAREYYKKALAIKADNPNVRTDLGLTYFFDRPSDPVGAIAEYRKSLQLDPRHELTLQNLVFAQIANGEYDEAGKTMATLESVNPANNSLPNMRAQLAQKRNAQ